MVNRLIVLFRLIVLSTALVFVLSFDVNNCFTFSLAFFIDAYLSVTVDARVNL
jgi:hypothetical protein